MSPSTVTPTMPASSYSISQVSNPCSNGTSATTTPNAAAKLSSHMFASTIEEENINQKFKQLKMSSNAPANIQLKFKKKNSIFTSSSSSTASPVLASKSSPTSNPPLSGSNNRETSKRLKTRSRSHSRGKYVNYFASAATAMKNAIKPSSINNAFFSVENSSKASISTQTSFNQSSSTSKQSKDILKNLPAR